MLMHQSGSASVRVVGTALVIAAASLFAGVAAADSSEVSAVVKYRDLDPSLSGDAQRLYSRLKDAAQRVCNIYDSRGLDLQRREEVCFDKALSDAVAKVNEPALTALHAAEPRIRVAKKD